MRPAHGRMLRLRRISKRRRGKVRILHTSPHTSLQHAPSCHVPLPSDPTSTTIHTILYLPGPHPYPPSRTTVIVIPPSPAVHAFLLRTARAEVARNATKAKADQKKERERLAAEKKEAKKQEKAEEKKEKARKAAEMIKEKEKEERIQAETKAKKKKKGGERSSNDDDDDDDDFDDSEEEPTKKKKRGDTCTIYSRIHIHRNMPHVLVAHT